MNDTRKRRFGVIVAVSAVALVLGATASAGLILKETFHDEGPLAFDDHAYQPRHRQDDHGGRHRSAEGSEDHRQR